MKKAKILYSDGVPHKLFPKCGKYLPLEAFYRNKKSPTGVSSYCKDCKRIINKEYEQRWKAELNEIINTAVEAHPDPTPEQEIPTGVIYNGMELFDIDDLVQELRNRHIRGELYYDVKITKKITL